MKNFIIRICIFFLIIAIIYIPFEWDILFSDKYIQRLDTGTQTVYHSIEKSKKKKKVKKLLIGDSTAEQLYNNYIYNDSIYSLACNQAITVVGQYFLLNNFIDANKDELPEEIIFLCNPCALLNNLDKYTFPYFLKPFYNEEYKPLIDNYLMKRIKTIPLYFISQIPLIKTSDYTPAKFCFPKEEKFEGIFSPLTKDYLKKIELLCKNNNIKFRFEPSPVSKSLWDILKLPENSDYPIDTLAVDNYFQKVNYFEDSLFVDGFHFKQQYIPKDFLNLMDTDSSPVNK